MDKFSPLEIDDYRLDERSRLIPPKTEESADKDPHKNEGLIAFVSLGKDPDSGAVSRFFIVRG